MVAGSEIRYTKEFAYTRVVGITELLRWRFTEWRDLVCFLACDWVGAYK